jgi:hypothetical protein
VTANFTLLGADKELIFDDAIESSPWESGMPHSKAAAPQNAKFY